MLYNECESGKTNRVWKVRDMLNVKRVNCVRLYSQYVVCSMILLFRLQDQSSSSDDVGGLLQVHQAPI